jgi:hypothetical protein
MPKAKPITDNMRDMLERIAGRQSGRQLKGRSEHGGAVTIWRALVKRGLIDACSNITPAGLEVIGRTAGVAPCAETYAGCAPDCHAGNRCTDDVTAAPAPREATRESLRAALGVALPRDDQQEKP